MPCKFKKIWDSAPNLVPSVTVWERKHKTRFQSGHFSLGVMMKPICEGYRDRMITSSVAEDVDATVWADVEVAAEPFRPPCADEHSADEKSSSSEPNAPSSASSASSKSQSVVKQDSPPLASAGASAAAGSARAMQFHSIWMTRMP